MCCLHPGPARESATTMYEPRTCTECGGNGGFNETSWSASGVRHDVWLPCQPCKGTGVR